MWCLLRKRLIKIATNIKIYLPLNKEYSSTFLQITHAMSSISSALAAATMGTPADVIKTRVMNQPLDDKGRGILISSVLPNMKPYYFYSPN